MKTLMVTLLLAFAVVSAPVVADTKDDIVAAEKNGWKAWAAHDATAYGETLTDDAVVVGASGFVMKGKQAILADLKNDPCEVKSYDLADTQVRQLSADSALLTYHLTQDVTCKDGKLAPKAFVTAVYLRQGGKWRCANYQETALKK